MLSGANLDAAHRQLAELKRAERRKSFAWATVCFAAMLVLIGGHLALDWLTGIERTHWSMTAIRVAAAPAFVAGAACLFNAWHYHFSTGGGTCRACAMPQPVGAKVGGQCRYCRATFT